MRSRWTGRGIPARCSSRGEDGLDRGQDEADPREQGEALGRVKRAS
jgi:hypothetical protein